VPRNIADAVLALNDHALDRLVARLSGLTDEELHWAPTPDAWDVRESNGQWVIDGDGGGPPWRSDGPAPLTTICWRVGHLGLSFLSFGGQLFGDFDVAVADVDFPGAADGVVPWVERCYHSAWREPVSALDEQGWWRPIGSRFGPYADDSVADLALHIVDEVVHHAAEAALMRDLYAHRGDRRST
jgi:hypothetical protein